MKNSDGNFTQAGAGSASGSDSAPPAGPPACQVCDGVRFQMTFTKSGRDFWRCAHCGMEQQFPLPTQSELASYYDDSYRQGMYETFVAYEEMKRMTAARRFHELRGLLKKKLRMLDVGCANGTFVATASAAGLEAEGVDLSQVAIDQAKSQGLKVRQGLLSDLPRDPVFDLITGFDVLEHVLDPQAFLADVFLRLKPGGWAALSTPDVSSLTRILMGSRWYFYIPEEHLFYFNPGTGKKLLTRAGFTSIRNQKTFKPLNFDYALTQFKEYNPIIYSLLNPAGKIFPAALRKMIIPLYIGEMMLIAQKPG